MNKENLYTAIIVLIIMLFCSTLFDDQTLASTCNSDCGCLSTVFEPVCSDGITYFSPCRAGCDKYFLNDDTDVSSVCICIICL